MHWFAEKLADVATSNPVDLSSQSRATESASTKWIRSPNEELIQLHTEFRVPSWRIKLVRTWDSSMYLWRTPASFPSLTSRHRGNNSIVNINDWNCANTRSIRIHRHQNTLNFAASLPTPAVSLVCSLGLLYVSVCSWKIGSRTFPRCSRKSPEYPETDANALMRHLHPRDVTQICRVSPGHYCIYAVADISRPGQEQQEQVEARVSDGG